VEIYRHELDRETGLYYAGARYYDPKVSFWLSVDPLAEEYPNWTPYNYTLQNPVNYIPIKNKMTILIFLDLFFMFINLLLSTV